MNSQIVDKFFESISAADVDTAMSYLHDDCVSHDMGTGQVMKGIEQNRADMENWTSTFSDMKVESMNQVESGNTVVTEMKMTGVNTGDMEMPDGSKLPATGKSIELRGCQITEFEDGKMIKTTQYYNMMSMMAQLGLMPE
ncbi:MAG: ester cyclase [Candidatus Neomarinimicrobiota bacterium]|tara:strand:+ start:2232 stop:2651 length:420 start_codon:yes stop_codon:yes gene_type:complete